MRGGYNALGPHRPVQATREGRETMATATITCRPPTPLVRDLRAQCQTRYEGQQTRILTRQTRWYDQLPPDSVCQLEHHPAVRLRNRKQTEAGGEADHWSRVKWIAGPARTGAARRT